MKSMTGYGMGRAEKSDTTVEVSVRSVNGRFFDLKLHMPSDYIEYEKDMRSQITRTVKRGSVSVVVSKKSLQTSDAEIVVNEGLAKDYLSKMKKLAQKLKIKPEITLDMISRVEDLIKVDKKTKVSAVDKDLLLKAAGEALKNLEKERVREGQALSKDISDRVQKMQALVKKIESSRKDMNLEHRERLQEKVAELDIKSFDSQRLSEEVVWLLDKSDITEEITRLKSHLENFQKIMKSSESEGKKLDFYTQELLREMNTIGSKANHSEITNLVIEAKNLIEQIKEQVQNIE